MKYFYRLLAREERGFTLIELLVVVSILGILATLAIPRITVALDDAKDKKGKSDLAIINNALERYYFDNGKYPAKFGDLTGYVKGGFSYQNSYGNYYFYAVYTDTKHFVLADPGSTPGTAPTDTTPADGVIDNTTLTGTAPAGKAPNVAAWKIDPGITTSITLTGQLTD
ncbi:MAG: prepilin-type N-terminal cleavage/methylation domain-containing protein [Firmicutes bacterium]|nr:prepilin-type N-terminal cleavage/methylation domain-containing protein [Bacillota bacterium]MCL5038954.1 prepilin-type N-terminal cleavage/methylation domain-containing protein [Bacillota bacterium]